MEIKQTNTPRYNPLKTWIVKEVARMYGVTNRHVYLVLEGARENEKIFESYMTIQENATQAVMIEAVTALVPFDNQTKKAV